MISCNSCIIHEKCGAKHTNKKSLHILQEGGTPTPPLPATRSNVGTAFNFKTHCIFCGRLVLGDAKHPKHLRLDESFSSVSTLGFDKTIQNDISKRKDEWAEEVKDRLNQTVADLHTSDSVYHRICISNFKTDKGKPQLYTVDSSHITDKKKKKEKRKADGL